MAHVFRQFESDPPNPMKKEYDKEITELCPNLYRDRLLSMQETGMCWGFQCGNGWYQLIKELSLQLEALICKLPEAERKDYRATCVKEKYATLTFYMTNSTHGMDELIRKADDDSARICEECGAPGRERGRCWYYTACNEHTRPRDRD